MTNERRQRMRIDLADWEGNKRYAEFNNFIVGSETNDYDLESIGSYSGTAGRYTALNYRSNIVAMLTYVDREFAFYTNFKNSNKRSK